MADDFQFGITMSGMAQENFSTCWYSSYKMALAAAGKGSIDIDAVLNGVGLDVNDAKENGLKDTDYPVAAKALGFTQFSGKLYNQTPSAWDWGLSDYAEAFLSVLQRGPLWVSRAGTKSNHIVLAYGYSSSGDKIWYANPWAPSQNDARQVWMKANDFVSRITGDTAAVQLHSSYK